MILSKWEIDRNNIRRGWTQINADKTKELFPCPIRVNPCLKLYHVKNSILMADFSWDPVFEEFFSSLTFID